MTIQHGTPEAGQGWRIVEIRRRPWGDALLHLVSEALQSVDFLVRLDTEGEREFGNLQALIQPYFPAWQGNLRLSAHAFQDGTYLFSVVLWYFPEHKIAIISITYVHRSVSQHIEKSLK